MATQIAQIPKLDGKRRLVRLDDAGKACGLAVLRGFNISGHCKEAGVPSRIPVRDSARPFLTRLAQDGFDLVRMPVIWEFLERIEGKWNDDLGRELVGFVEEAAKVGIEVIIDIHQDLLGSIFRMPGTTLEAAEMHGTGFPPWLLERAYSASGATAPFQNPSWHDLGTGHWPVNYRENAQLKACFTGLATDAVLATVQAFAKRIGELFSGCPNVLAYEVMNEPMAPFSGALFANYFSAVRTGLLAGDPRARVTAMPHGDWNFTNWGPVPDLAIATSPEELSKEIDLSALGGVDLSTAHLYDPAASARVVGLFPSTVKYGAAVDAALAQHDAWGVAWLVGEFGVPSDVTGGDRLAVLGRWLDVFEQRGLSWCLWNFNPEAGPGGDDHWCREKFSLDIPSADHPDGIGAEYLALLRPIATRVSGPILEADFRRTGPRWQFDFRVGAALDSAWTTELVLPESLGAFAVTHAPAYTPSRAGRGLVFGSSSGEAQVSLRSK